MRKVVMIAAMFVALGAAAQTPKQWRDSVSVLIEQINLNPNNLEQSKKKASI